MSLICARCWDEQQSLLRNASIIQYHKVWIKVLIQGMDVALGLDPYLVFSLVQITSSNC